MGQGLECNAFNSGLRRVKDDNQMVSQGVQLVLVGWSEEGMISEDPTSPRKHLHSPLLAPRPGKIQVGRHEQARKRV